MGKLFSFRKPKIKLTKKGLKVTNPSLRIGGKAGVNVSKSGVSASLRTSAGTVNSKRGISLRGFGRKAKSGCLPGCLLPLLAGLAVVGLWFVRK